MSGRRPGGVIHIDASSWDVAVDIVTDALVRLGMAATADDANDILDALEKELP